ncbi:hypothetical protein ACFXPA_42160 [Amycolatopsis sp. NPDC059090]|uniref:hypothetical protein n=1 Tax=Amycolatopsis sp. NPDC059090 TaxID=3346723 RepID=UPI00366E356B
MSIYLAPDHGCAQWRGHDQPVVVSLTIRNPTGVPARLVEIYSVDYEHVWLGRADAGPAEEAADRRTSPNQRRLIVPLNDEVVLGPESVPIVAHSPRRQLGFGDLVSFALMFASETTLVAWLRLTG